MKPCCSFLHKCVVMYMSTCLWLKWPGRLRSFNSYTPPPPPPPFFQWTLPAPSQLEHRSSAFQHSTASLSDAGGQCPHGAARKSKPPSSHPQTGLSGHHHLPCRYLYLHFYSKMHFYQSSRNVFIFFCRSAARLCGTVQKHQRCRWGVLSVSDRRLRFCCKGTVLASTTCLCFMSVCLLICSLARTLFWTLPKGCGTEWGGRRLHRDQCSGHV